DAHSSSTYVGTSALRDRAVPRFDCARLKATSCDFWLCGHYDPMRPNTRHMATDRYLVRRRPVDAVCARVFLDSSGHLQIASRDHEAIRACRNLSAIVTTTVE